MGQVLSQDAVALTSAHACIESVMKSQHVHIDLGTERATCTLRAKMCFHSNPKVSAWRLWTGDETRASFMDSRIDTSECTRDPYIVMHGDGVYLIVPAARTSDPVHVSLTLYIQTPLAAHRPTAPWSMQCPVLLCNDNKLTCEFYAYKPGSIQFLTNPPLTSHAWTSSSTGERLSATFSATDVFGMQWMRNSEVCSNNLHAESASVVYHTSAFVLHLWSEEDDCHLPYAVFDVDMQIALTTPFIETLEREAHLDLVVDTHDNAATWETLAFECESALARRVPATKSEETTQVHTYTISTLVDVAVACGAFGAPPAYPTQFVVRGRMLMPMQDRSNAPRITLPSLHLPIDNVSHVYKVRFAPTSEAAPLYALDILEPMMPSLETRRVKDTMVNVAAQRCVVRFLHTDVPSVALTKPPASFIPASVDHTIWPGVPGGSAHHRLTIHTQVLLTGTYTVCILPYALTGLEVVQCGEISRNVHAYTMPHMHNVPRAHSIEVRVERNATVDIEVRFVTPSSVHGLNIQRPLFLAGVPTYTLTVHGTMSYNVFFQRANEAHIVYGKTAVATWLNLPARTPEHIRIKFVKEQRFSRWDQYVLALAVLSLAIAIVAIAWAWSAHTTARQLSMRIDALAMALDIDFTDGHWEASSEAPYTHVHTHAPSFLSWLRSMRPLLIGF